MKIMTNPVEEEYIETNCDKCSSRQYLKQRGKHIGLYCDKCGWKKWMRQKPEKFEMPFGKYRLKTLGWIKEEDPEYLEWAVIGLDSENIKSRIREIL